MANFTGLTDTHTHTYTRYIIIVLFYSNNLLHVHKNILKLQNISWNVQVFLKCVNYFYFFVFHYRIILYCSLRIVSQELHKRTMAIKGNRHRLNIPYATSCEVGERGYNVFDTFDCQPYYLSAQLHLMKLLHSIVIGSKKFERGPCYLKSWQATPPSRPSPHGSDAYAHNEKHFVVNKDTICRCAYY